MNKEHNTVCVKILESQYKVKCPQDKITELKESSSYLDAKMREIQENTNLASVDRIAVIAALNLANELLLQQQQKHRYIDLMNQRIQELQNKIETALEKETA